MRILGNRWVQLAAVAIVVWWWMRRPAQPPVQADLPPQPAFSPWGFAGQLIKPQILDLDLGIGPITSANGGNWMSV